MKRYWIIAIGMLGFFLILFFAVEALNISILVDPSERLSGGGIFAAALGVGLLVADIVLPVPSSIVMVAHGAVFGVAVGALLSVVGSAGAAIAGFAIGRRGGPLLERLVTEEERERVDRLLERWGALAIVITRPVPLIAETVAILAGASPISWGRAMAAAIAGSLPASALYAMTGAIAASFQSGVLMFGIVISVAGAFWFISRRMDARLSRRESRPTDNVTESRRTI